MFTLQGKYNSCKVFTDIADAETQAQLVNLMNQPFTENSTIRIMPDCHAGAGCTIGTTMTITDKVCPNLVGVDIGCGVLAVKLKEKDIDLSELDRIIHEHIPAGGCVHDNPRPSKTKIDVEDLACYKDASVRDMLAYCSVGTLGGGNHFIELDKDSGGNLWLVIHTGSRHLGLEVANFYQNKAWEILTAKANNGDRKSKLNAMITQMKADGKQKDIQKAVEKFNKNYREILPSIPKDLAYLESECLDAYLHDMAICQQYAHDNRAEIAATIIKQMSLHELERFETVHNYIDLDNMILRKGAVSAQLDEKLIIPMNMRDGSLICIGKGNENWNCSAPHGAGRLMSRSKAKELVTMSEFENSMKNIYTTSVNESTIDESPMAYKPMKSIVNAVQDTVEIIDIIKPVYNFKASI